MELKVTISDEDFKVLKWQLMDPQDWLQKAIEGKISKSRSRMLPELTDKREDKLTQPEIQTLIKNSKLKTRVEREKA